MITNKINSIARETSKKRFGTCSKDCYGSCVFIGEWNDAAPEQKFLRAEAIKDHLFTQGFFCSKLSLRKNLIYHPKRLKNSLIRTAEKGVNSFKAINLNKSMDIVSGKLCYIKDKFGPDSILVAFNAGNFGLLSRYGPLRFFNKLGSTITTGGICNEGGCAGLSKIFGTYSTTNPFQIINPKTELLIVWGSNLSDRNIHAYFLVKKAISGGLNLVVIDSRRTQIANEAQLFIYTNPGVDHLLALIILKKLISRNEIDTNFLTNYVNGYEKLLKEIIDIDEEKLISCVGIDAQSLDGLINLFIEHKHHTIINIGFGVQKDYYGGRIVQAIALIQILLGNIGKPGTGLIYSQSDFNKNFIIPLLNYITKISVNSLKSDVNLLNLGSAIGSDRYKMLFIYNFNPVSSLPNQSLLKEGLLREDLFVVVNEIFLNETTKYADIVLPSKFDLETNDLIAPYYVPGISINQAGPCPYPNCMSNYEFYQKLAWKIGWKEDPLLQESEESIFQQCIELLPLKIKKNLKSNGYHLLFKHNDVAFKDLNFPTLDGKIQLNNLHFQFGQLKLYQQLNRKKNSFFLITPSHKSFIHSQLGQLHPNHLEDFNKIYLNPLDIKKLDLRLAEEVLVSNELGNEKYIIEELNTLNIGVAMIYSGCPLGSKRNINSLISDKPEELGLSGAYNSALISISKVDSSNNQSDL